MHSGLERAVVVTQLAEQLLLVPDVLSSNPSRWQIFRISMPVQCIEKTKMKKSLDLQVFLFDVT